LLAVLRVREAERRDELPGRTLARLHDVRYAQRRRRPVEREQITPERTPEGQREEAHERLPDEVSPVDAEQRDRGRVRLGDHAVPVCLDVRDRRLLEQRPKSLPLLQSALGDDLELLLLAPQLLLSDVELLHARGQIREEHIQGAAVDLTDTVQEPAFEPRYLYSELTESGHRAAVKRSRRAGEYTFAA